MRAKFVHESISFERGGDPKEILGIGPITYKIYFYYIAPEAADDDMIRDDMNMMEEAILDLDENAEVNVRPQTLEFGTGYISIKTIPTFSVEDFINHLKNYSTPFSGYTFGDSYGFAAY